MKRRNRLCGRMMILLLMAAVMLIGGAALAEEQARDITGNCRITSGSSGTLFRLTDERTKLCYEGESGRVNSIEITLPANEESGGLWIYWSSAYACVPVRLEGRASSEEEYTTICDVNMTGFIQEYAAAEGYHQLRLVSGEQGILPVSELKVLSRGTLPDWVHIWEPCPTDVELLIYVAHPDDEFIFLGGMIPYYAAECGVKTAVAYMTNGNDDVRVHELLNGLWTAGYRCYPYLINAEDYFCRYVPSAYKMWGGEDAALDLCAKMLNDLRPQVVVTHDINGEYGHGHHKAAATLMLSIIRDGARPLDFEVKKLYLHLWEENRIKLDWSMPLETFGGQTAIEIAAKGFACHVTQQGESAEMEDGRRFYFNVKLGGPYDNGVFGLAYTTVGVDEEADLMDHIEVYQE